MRAEYRAAVSRGIASTWFSIWRSQASQYWGVMARRGAALRLAPPRCQRVPMNTTTDPAGMITDSIRESSSAGRSPPQR